MAENKNSHLDQDIHKGAVEDDSPASEHNTSMRGQQGHRNVPEMAEGTDTDYPEPGSNPEHSGEKGATNDAAAKKSSATSAEQKTNQNQRKDDLLAS